MRAYTVAATSVTLNVPIKWVDNVLSHHRLSGVAQKRQGVRRRITADAILVLEIALRVSRAIGTPLHRSLELANLLIAEKDASVELPGGLMISLDVTGIEAELSTRLAHAVEVAPSPRRGRPRGA
jgi:hypothetical protein